MRFSKGQLTKCSTIVFTTQVEGTAQHLLTQQFQYNFVSYCSTHIVMFLTTNKHVDKSAGLVSVCPAHTLICAELVGGRTLFWALGCGHEYGTYNIESFLM